MGVKQDLAETMASVEPTLVHEDRTSAAGDFLSKLEESEFREGKCPDCGTPLVPLASGYACADLMCGSTFEDVGVLGAHRTSRKRSRPSMS